jgi:hypothetical protein
MKKGEDYTGITQLYTSVMTEKVTSCSTREASSVETSMALGIVEVEA